MDTNNDFWKFSDQLRLESSLANLSLNDYSIWSNSYSSKRPDQRRNFDVVKGSDDFNDSKQPCDDGWNMTNSNNGPFFSMPQNNNNNNTLGGFNNGGIYSNSLNNNTLGPFNKGIYSNTTSSPYLNLNNNINNHHLNNNLNNNLKGYKTFFKGEDHFYTPKSAKKNNNTNNKKHGDNTNNDVTKTAAEKKFKTLPPSESLPKNETIGGYIFVCNNDTMEENLKRQLFGMFALSILILCISQ